MTLIERIEGAEGPSRELDAEIALHLAGQRNWRKLKPWKRTNGWAKPDVAWDAWCVLHYDTGGNPLPFPAYTASLDAAMSLVPEGWNWMAGERDQGRCRAYVNNGELQFTGLGGMRRNPQSIWHEVVAATPALALCAAALRAIGDTHDD